MEPRISLITLGVADLARSRRFYEQGLGLPVRPESQASVVFFGLHGLWLGLYSREALADDAQLAATARSQGGSAASRWRTMFAAGAKSMRC